ncbi:MAG TPA: hypothetical protein VKZ63_06595 [Kofleriaceae bacterium]|nr:hypothetical protein [Kofleriaceae bacterium]
MRGGIFVLCAAALCACGGEEGLDPPTDCPTGALSYVYELDSGGEAASGEGSVTLGTMVFVNALSDDEPGRLLIGEDGATQPVVSIEFDDPVARGDSVPARGFVSLPGGEIDVGNCETGDFSGTIGTDADGDGYWFSLVDLHLPPYCEGAAVDGSIAGCYRHEPF